MTGYRNKRTLKRAMKAEAERDRLLDALRSISTYAGVNDDGTHQACGDGCGEDLCIVCLIQGTADAAVGTSTREQR